MLYEGKDPSSGRPVLVKVVRKEVLATAVERQRALRELQKLLRVRHPALASILEVGEDQERIWVVREWIPGESLSERLARSGPLPLSEVARIGSHVAAALGEIHRAGALHRDVRPHHVLIDSAGLVKLIDAGTGRTFRAPDGRVVIGTPGYVSPEAIAGKLVSFRSDLYSLGATLFELLSGSPPYGAPDTPDVLARQRDTEAPPLPVPAPEAVRKLIASLLSREPRERPFSAQQLERQLEPFAVASPTEARPVVLPDDEPQPTVIAKLPFEFEEANSLAATQENETENETDTEATVVGPDPFALSSSLASSASASGAARPSASSPKISDRSSVQPNTFSQKNTQHTTAIAVGPTALVRSATPAVPSATVAPQSEAKPAEHSGSIARPAGPDDSQEFEDINDTLVQEDSRIFGLPDLVAGSPHGSAVPPLPESVAARVLTGAIRAPSPDTSSVRASASARHVAATPWDGVSSSAETAPGQRVASHPSATPSGDAVSSMETAALDAVPSHTGATPWDSVSSSAETVPGIVPRAATGENSSKQRATQISQTEALVPGPAAYASPGTPAGKPETSGQVQVPLESFLERANAVSPSTAGVIPSREITASSASAPATAPIPGRTWWPWLLAAIGIAGFSGTGGYLFALHQRSAQVPVRERTIAPPLPQVRPAANTTSRSSEASSQASAVTTTVVENTTQPRPTPQGDVATASPGDKTDASTPPTPPPPRHTPPRTERTTHGTLSSSSSRTATQNGSESLGTLEQARQALARRDYVSARTMLNLAVRQHPTNAEAHHLLGDLLARAREMRGATIELREAVRLAPRNGQYLRRLAEVQIAANDRSGAMATLRQMLQIDSRNVWARQQLESLARDSAATTSPSTSVQRTSATPPGTGSRPTSITPGGTTARRNDPFIVPTFGAPSRPGSTGTVRPESTGTVRRP